ncbi:hypothetical protein AOQ84DRAFT_442234 [Glonium stellatum]|uniref:F-box domain-containing protein n=1 Tax=Glonium stellatum TaxID=574774 RepID=A0A8E2EST7_9PEZI|nr:hypothetical protein AOQ84DRAFT_442234 [Glonium stellatum]
MINVVTRLNNLPPELVEAIVMYLPISAAIEVSRQSPYLSDCLSRSPSWRHLFSTSGQCEALQRMYSQFVNFHELIYSKPFEHGSIHCYIDLVLSYNHSASRNWSRCVDPVLDLYHHLEGFVKEIFQRVSKEQLKHISRFLPESLDWPFTLREFNFKDSTSPDFEEVRGLLMQFRKAEDDFNDAFSKSVYALAGVLLKCATQIKIYAGSCQSPRKSISSIITFLFNESSILSKSRILNLGFNPKCLANSHSILPFDKCLALLLQVLTEHPPRPGLDGFSVFSAPKSQLNQTKGQRAAALGNLGLVDLLTSLSIDYDIYDLGKASVPYSYPRNIAIDMWTVTDGLGLANNPDPGVVDLEAFWGTPVPVDHWGFDFLWSMHDVRNASDREAGGERASQWFLAFQRCSAFCEKTFPEIAERIGKGCNLG